MMADDQAMPEPISSEVLKLLQKSSRHPDERIANQALGMFSRLLFEGHVLCHPPLSPEQQQFLREIFEKLGWRRKREIN